MEENQKKDKNSIGYMLLDFLKTFVLCAIIVYLFTTFVMRPVQVDGLSMYPTLHDDEIGLMNIIDMKIHDIQRYDVVVVVNDAEITNGEAWVKRVIGLPGDTIYAKDDVVYVNGLAIEEPYLDNEYANDIRSRGDQFTHDFDKVTLGEDEYFLMGDNRIESHDSRAVGPFKRSDFKGKDIYILYPFSNIRFERNGSL